MSGATAEVLNLAAGALVLCAVLVVWRREVRAMVRLVAVQGVALSALPLTLGVHARDWALIGVGVGVFVMRVAVLPALLGRAVRAESSDARESTPLMNTAASLLVAAVLTLTAFAIGRPIVALEPTAATRAVPAAIAVVLIAVFVMASRRQALSQAVGFLMLDNGIAAIAFLTTSGVPIVVELGASLDVLFAVLIIGVLAGRLRLAFGNTDLDQLRELHD